MTNRIAVIGGAGYVGSVLVRHLLRNALPVRVIDRGYFGWGGLATLGDRIERVTADMRTLAPEHLEDCRAVINIGGLSNDPTAEFDPAANLAMNRDAAVALATAAKAAGVSRYVYASTASVYDTYSADEPPLAAESATYVGDSPWPYTQSKLLAEKALQGLASEDFRVVVLRKATISGFSPRFRSDLCVNAFVRQAITTGKLSVFHGGRVWRPIVDVRDVANAYLCAVVADMAPYNVFNISGGNYRISELALEVADICTREGIPTQVTMAEGGGHLRNYRMTSLRALAELNWMPQHDIEDTVSDLIYQYHMGYWDATDTLRTANLPWMAMLTEAEQIIGVTGRVW